MTHAERLGGQPVPGHTLLGTVSPFVAATFGLPADCVVAASSGDNPCAIAGLGLARAGDLARHVRTMHEKRGDDFPCPHCDAAFGEVGTRVRHVLTKHKGEPSEADCLICFEPLNGVAPTAATRCGHRFCRSCIEVELRRSGKCPMCRTSCSATGLTNLVSL